MKSKFVLALAASMAVAGSANAADLYNGMKDDLHPYQPAASASGWWLDAGGGAMFKYGTAKGNQTYTVPGSTVTGPDQSIVIPEHTVVTDPGSGVKDTPGYIPPTTITVPKETITVSGQTVNIPAKTVTTSVKSHLSATGALAELRGGYAFNLGGGWFFGPALGVGYTADSDSVTYSGALELGRKWGNAQLKVGAGYMGQHVRGEPFSGASFGTDAGGFMGLVQGDLFLNKNSSLFVRVEEVANGSFNASGNGYAYKVNTYDTLAVAGVGFHW